MGEVADMMLDGTLCQGCGVFLNDDPPGYPCSCHDCKKGVKTRERKPQPIAKVRYPTCNKKVKHNGLADHQRDAHKSAVNEEELSHGS